MRVRPRYTEEFRRDAIALMRSTDRSFSELASDLGVSSWTLRQWYKGVEVPKKSRKQRKADTATQPGDESTEQKLARLERENQTLRKENDSLRMDREILKKAAANSRGGCNSETWYPSAEGNLSEKSDAWSEHGATG